MPVLRKTDPVPMLYIPDTMSNWLWKRQINPHYKEASAQSNAWFSSFNPISKYSQNVFNKSDFGRFAALAYPWSSKEHLRTGCDLMNLLFVIDGCTDAQPASNVHEIINIILDAVHNPHTRRPEGEILVGEMTRQFWERAIQTASQSSQRHFIESFTTYLHSLVTKSLDRDNNSIHSIESYLQFCRKTCAMRPLFLPVELRLNLPDAAFYHPVIVELSSCIIDLITINHDMISYNMEQSFGNDRYNTLTIVMHELNTNLEGAMAWAAGYHAEVQRKFLDGLKRIPSFGRAVDKQVQEYIYGLGNCVRSNDCWSFESRRYFGSRGLEVQKTRYVPLFPKLKERLNYPSAGAGRGPAY